VREGGFKKAVHHARGKGGGGVRAIKVFGLIKIKKEKKNNGNKISQGGT